MTVPVERTNAVIRTGKFLLDLLDPKKTPRVPRSIRQDARNLLRHYPTEFDMNMIAEREDGVGNKMCIYKVFGKSYL
jgi:hypothetical protein